jgi:hypothetical protein
MMVYLDEFYVSLFLSCRACVWLPLSYVAICCFRHLNVFLNRMVRAPPPPPPPLLGQALLQMTQLLGQMQQTQHNFDQGRQENGRVMIRDFLQLNP